MKIFAKNLRKNSFFGRSKKNIWVLSLKFYSIKFSSYRSSGVRVIIVESNVFDFIFSKLKAKQKFDSNIGKFDSNKGKFNSNIGKFDYILVKISKIKLKFDSNLKMFDSNKIKFDSNFFCLIQTYV